MPSQFKYAGNAVAYATVLEALIEAPYTIDELIKVSGLADNTTWKFVTALRRRGLVYVAVWRTDKWGRHTRPAYKFGTMLDVVRPAPKTASRRSLERRQRNALLAMTRTYDVTPASKS
jgi:hypothetical protein